MADNQPTEDQVKQANEAEMKKWEGDFDPEDLAVRYETEEEEKQSATPAATSDDDNDEPEEPEVVETHSEPEPIITVDNPGEYKPADYSFEVTLKDGKTKKVTTPEQAEALADDPDNFETPKQLMDFLNKQNKMNIGLDKDKEKWEAQKEKFDEQSETAQQRQTTIDNFANEFKYLENKKLLPKIEKQYLDADWNDPEVAKQPGVKEQIELLNYMVSENEARTKAKVKPLTSIVDAFNAWQFDSNRKQQEDDEKKSGETRKAAGARVAGVSASQQGAYVPKGIAVGNPNIFKRSESIWED